MLEQGISRKFTKVSENKTKIIDAIVTNETIIRHSLDLGEVDIDNIKITKDRRKSFFDNNIIFDYFTHDLKITDIVYYMVTPVRGYTGVKSPLNSDTYNISIICPVRFWFIKEKMIERPFVIAEEISKTLDQQRLFGIGQTEISNWRAFRVNDDFACLELSLSVSDMAIKK